MLQPANLTSRGRSRIIHPVLDRLDRAQKSKHRFQVIVIQIAIHHHRHNRAQLPRLDRPRVHYLQKQRRVLRDRSCQQQRKSYYGSCNPFPHTIHEFIFLKTFEACRVILRVLCDPLAPFAV